VRAAVLVSAALLALLALLPPDDTSNRRAKGHCRDKDCQHDQQNIRG
jgi:hypothetical protein